MYTMDTWPELIEAKTSGKRFDDEPTHRTTERREGKMPVLVCRGRGACYLLVETRCRGHERHGVQRRR